MRSAFIHVLPARRLAIDRPYKRLSTVGLALQLPFSCGSSSVGDSTNVASGRVVGLARMKGSLSLVRIVITSLILGAVGAVMPDVIRLSL